MDFRTRLLRTLRSVEPNLLQPGARSTLIVSKDLDIAIPVKHHAAVKARLDQLHGLRRSEEEPSVWKQETRRAYPGETYVLEDNELPEPFSLMARLENAEQNR